MGVCDSETNWMTLMAWGEPDGPISASTFSSVMSFWKMAADWLTRLASSSAMYSMPKSPARAGSKGTVLRCGIPTSEVEPVEEATTPILTCASAGAGSAKPAARPSASTAEASGAHGVSENFFRFMAGSRKVGQGWTK